MTESPVIEAFSLSKRYAGLLALDGLCFALPRGAFLAVFGPNGAGKSTLLNLLSTLFAPSQGTAAVFGFDLVEEAERIRPHIGLISHQSMLFPDLTAHENLALFAKLYGVADPDKRADGLLEQFGLTSRRHDRVRTLSRGMTQRMAIARALVNDPEILLVDEPYSGLDSRAATLLDELIEHSRLDKTIVMISHDLARTYQKATHVLILDKGRALLFSDRDSIPMDDFPLFYQNLVEA
ncbi:MAG: ABC transporter ATP-binding protein [Coriobacteriia bacterium]|nr:ABC transporter ATP-binding protein [Coriobacteriia bacterium]